MTTTPAIHYVGSREKIHHVHYRNPPRHLPHLLSSDGAAVAIELSPAITLVPGPRSAPTMEPDDLRTSAP